MWQVSDLSSLHLRWINWRNYFLSSHTTRLRSEFAFGAYNLCVTQHWFPSTACRELLNLKHCILQNFSSGVTSACFCYKLVAEIFAPHACRMYVSSSSRATVFCQTFKHSSASQHTLQTPHHSLLCFYNTLDTFLNLPCSHRSFYWGAKHMHFSCRFCERYMA